MIARRLEPNMAYGSKPSETGLTFEDGTVVEVSVDYFEEFGAELDKHPIGTLRVIRGM